MRRPLVAGNWKMHHLTREAVAFAEEVRPALERWTDVDAALCPPATLLPTLARALAGSRLRLGGQTCHWEREGAFTGEVSAAMLADCGCSLVLVGHSERRQLFGETDEDVGRKLHAAVEAGLTAVLCVGETEGERVDGRTEDVLRRQLGAALAAVGADVAGRLIVAYEPVWAIGTGRTATPDAAQEAHAFLRRELGAAFAEGAAARIAILYGGSVKPGNFRALLDQPDVDGGLVGGASLQAEAFGRLLEEASRLKPRGV
jgi:triosephosphate isomerase